MPGGPAPPPAVREEGPASFQVFSGKFGLNKLPFFFLIILFVWQASCQQDADESREWVGAVPVWPKPSGSRERKMLAGAAVLRSWHPLHFCSLLEAFLFA